MTDTVEIKNNKLSSETVSDTLTTHYGSGINIRTLQFMEFSNIVSATGCYCSQDGSCVCDDGTENVGEMKMCGNCDDNCSCGNSCQCENGSCSC